LTKKKKKSLLTHLSSTHRMFTDSKHIFSAAEVAGIVTAGLDGTAVLFVL
jgi:hypothetical protein